MANETLTPDGNTRNIAGAVTDDSLQEIRKLRIDDATKGLKVMLVGGVGLGTVTSVSVTTANGVSGVVATATTTPAITLTLGAITPSSVNGASSTEIGYLVGVTSAIQTQLNTKGSGTVTAVSIATANGFSGSSSGGATPALTIVAGAITPTTVNGNTFTTGTYTLTGQAGKTLTFNGSITLTGTDAQTYTFPTTTATIARTDAANTFTGASTATSWVFTTPLLGTPTSGVLTNCTGLPAASVVAGTFGTGAYTMDTQLTVPQIFNTAHAVTASSNAVTVTRAFRNWTITNNSAATLTVTLSTSGAVDGDMVKLKIVDFSAVAQTLTIVNGENSTISFPIVTNGSTTSPLTIGIDWNPLTSKWRCVASA